MTSTSDRLSILSGAPGVQRGWQETIYPVNPAQGQLFSLTIDGSAWVRLLVINYTLTTSAVVANRFPRLGIRDQDGVNIWIQQLSGGIPASTAAQLYAAQGLGTLANGTSGLNSSALPDFLIPPGWQIQSQVSAIDAGDQISHIQLVVQRFPSDLVAQFAEG